MNQETIPDNNLPVYLQRYNVDILDDKKESVGKVLYTTVGAIPSNEKEKRVWQLNLTGYLKPNIDTYHILYDFSEVDYKYKENISFENIISGTFSICGQVLDASKIIGFDYTYSDAESTLTIKLDTSKWNFRLKKEVLFSYQLNVDDDASSTCPLSATCSAITTSDYSAINTSSTTTATLSTNSDNLLSYTDLFATNNDSTTIYGIYMDIVKQSDYSYFTISSLYVNSCTEGNTSCSLYDVSYSDTSGNTVSGIIPSGFSYEYVQTTVTILTLNISLLFYVNSSSEYYFVVACPSSVSPSTYCTSITPSAYTAINTSSTTTATLSTNSDNLLSYTDLFATNDSTTIYGIYMDIVKKSDSDSYFTISSLYVNSCTEGNISCSNSYDVSYSNSSGIMIPSGSNNEYVPTTVTISILNISLLFYVNSSSEYYFVVACPSSVSPPYCTSITPSAYTAINTSSTTTATLSTNSDNLLSYDYTTCQFNKFGFQGTVYSVYFVVNNILESNGTKYFTIPSLYSLFCCNSGTDCNGTDCENAAAYVKYDNSNGKKIPGITIPADGESAETVVSLKYGLVKETFATFYLTNNGKTITYYACMNTDFCISPSTSCSSSSS